MSRKMATPSKDAAPKQVNILDMKRLTAIGVKMAKLKVHWSQVRAATDKGSVR